MSRLLAKIALEVFALRLSAILVRGSASVDELASRCQIERSKVNAFFWAMRAGGLLSAEGAVPATVRREEPPPAPALSIVSRLARRFGLLFGSENRHV